MELHGLGQRVDHRGGSGAAAADLSASDDCGGGAGGADIRRAIRSGVLRGDSGFDVCGRWFLGHDRGIDRRENSGFRVATIPDRGRGDDERVRDVQRAGDELFAAAAGDGAGWNAAKDFRENEQAHGCTVGSHPGMCDLLGVVFGAGVQAAGDHRHHAVWREPEPGICNASGAAHS